MARSKLQIFSKDHPVANLVVVRNTDIFWDIPNPASPMPEEWGPVDVVWNCRVICTYTRRRDAIRALKACGYVPEGHWWRQTPANALPVTKVSMEVSDLIGDL